MGSTGPSHKRESIFAYLRRMQKMVCDKVDRGRSDKEIARCVPYAGLSQTQVQVAIEPVAAFIFVRASCGASQLHWVPDSRARQRSGLCNTAAMMHYLWIVNPRGSQPRHRHDQQDRSHWSPRLACGMRRSHSTTWVKALTVPPKFLHRYIPSRFHVAFNPIWIFAHSPTRIVGSPLIEEREIPPEQQGDDNCRAAHTAIFVSSDISPPAFTAHR